MPVARSNEQPLSSAIQHTKTTKHHARQTPNQSCIRAVNWSVDQQMMLLRALVRSDVKLHPEESLVIPD